MELSVLFILGVFGAMGAWLFWAKMRPSLNEAKYIVPDADEVVLKTVTRVEKLDNYLGYPYAKLSFDDDTESIYMAPDSLLSKELPWSFEAKWAQDAPLDSSKVPLETYLSVHTSAAFRSEDEDWQWTKEGLHYSLAVDEDWLLFTMSDFAQIPEDEATISFSAYDEEIYNYDPKTDFKVDGIQIPESRHLWVELDYMEREEAELWIGSYSPQLLQRIAQYCYYGDGEIIVTKTTVTADFAVAFWDTVFLEDILHETQEIARRVKGLSPLQRDDQW